MIDFLKMFVTIYLSVGAVIFLIVFLNDIYLNYKHKQNRYKVNTVTDFVIMFVCALNICVIVSITFPKVLFVWWKADVPRLLNYISAKMKYLYSRMFGE